MLYKNHLDFAEELDRTDPLRSYRELFHIPKDEQGNEYLYFTGNSLGLQPRTTKEAINQELDDWARLGVEGHFHAKYPWFSYHEQLTESTARLVGAKPIEVVVMNSLSVNLHLMMVSFYRPTRTRYKILMEKGAFPSDQYAIASQLKFHGVNPEEGLIELAPRPGMDILRTEDILESIKQHGHEVALVLIGNVNYLTGQAFDIAGITQAGHAQGCYVGFDLAHGVGNLELKLHDWGPDFAVWCSYKYLNSGPGAIAGCFVHERHSQSVDLPRFAGWWGHNKEIRFQMGPQFQPIPGAEGWQLSNPPIFQLAALRASMEIFDRATMGAIREKSVRLTGYLEFLLKESVPEFCHIITPTDPNQRGAQLSLRFLSSSDQLKDSLKRWIKKGIVCDFREPNIIRVAPVALYNRFTDVYLFSRALAEEEWSDGTAQ